MIRDGREFCGKPKHRIGGVWSVDPMREQLLLLVMKFLN